MRVRAESNRFAVETAAALSESLPTPPAPLNNAAAQHWETVVMAKRRDAWTESDLLLAVHLCRDLAMLESLNTELERDGLTLTNDKGRRYPHPAAAILDATQRRILATCRQIQIHAIATTGKTDHQGKKNETARQLAKTLGETSELIPTKANWMN